MVPRTRTSGWKGGSKPLGLNEYGRACVECDMHVAADLDRGWRTVSIMASGREVHLVGTHGCSTEGHLNVPAILHEIRRMRDVRGGDPHGLDRWPRLSVRRERHPEYR